MHPHRKEYPDDVYYFLLRGIRERFWDWRHQFLVVVVNEGGRERVVGAADWRRLGRGGEGREVGGMDLSEFGYFLKFCIELMMLIVGNLVAPMLKTYHNLTLKIWPNRAADPSRSSFLDTAVANSERYWTGDRAECWDLHVCGVDPEFQGKGVGKLLAQWGVNEAKKEGDNVVASVLCGEKNRGFYGKAGMGVQVGGSGGEGGGIALFSS